MSNVPSVQKAKESAGNIFTIIDEKSTLDVREQRPGMKTKIEHGEIVFSDVNFNYPSRQASVLKNFSMIIPATQKIALVGHSGCGKSTITNLLLRFYNIKRGRIEIDGTDISEYDVRELRRQIGFVMQEPVLFNQTIKQNILYGDTDASDEQILKVAEMANALTFIESNVEDLDKEERIKQNAKDLKEIHLKHLVDRPSLKDLDLADLSETQTSLLLQVLNKADSVALDMIAKQPIQLMNQLKRDSQIAGMRWDDLVLRFELQCNLTSYLEGASL